MKKGKVALVTIYHVPNYGSVLQAFATQCLIEKLGFECSILNYKYPNKWHISQDPKRKGSIKSNIITFLGIKSIHRKNKTLKKFRKKYFNFSKKYNSKEALERADLSIYDVFVAGSDQIWNSRFTLADSVFMLSFAPKGKKLVSIASSFASDHIPKGYTAKYHKHLSKFSSISVREENGKSIIEKELNIQKEAKVLLDPTLLISKDEWLEKFPLKNAGNEKYILLYLLTYAFESRPYVFEVIKFFQDKYDYKVIALEGYTKQENALGVQMKDKTDAGVENYMSLFANAQMIITTSFHGTAFAANFGIPLVSITPQNGDDRQTSLLKKLGMSQCITPVGTETDRINPFYDINASQNKLNKLRNECLAWIDNALSKQ